MRFTLKKNEILRGRKNFEHLLTNCRKYEGKILRCYVNTKPAEVKIPIKTVVVAFAVKKTLKRAVDRNRVRRLMREAYRLNKSILHSQSQNTENSIHILFVYSHSKQKDDRLPSFDSIQEDLRSLLENISKRTNERI